MRRPPEKDGYFCVAVITGAHGIRGEVNVKSFTEIPEDFMTYGDLVDIHGSPFVFVSTRSTNKGILATLQGVKDRNAAEALKHTYIYAAEDQRPDLDDSDAYLDDLMGMSVQREDGSTFGTIKGHFDNGAQTVLIIKHPESGQKDILIPFTEEMISTVDHEKKILFVTDFAEQMANINQI